MIDARCILPVFALFGVGLFLWGVAIYKDEVGMRLWAIGMMLVAIVGLFGCASLLFTAF